MLWKYQIAFKGEGYQQKNLQTLNKDEIVLLFRVKYELKYTLMVYINTIIWLVIIPY